MNCQRFFSRRFLAVMATAGVIALAPLSRAYAHGYLQTNLVSDEISLAPKTVDPKLVNPWGVAFFPGGPFWISDNAASPDGVSTLYDGVGDNLSAAVPLTVTIPTEQGDNGQGAPGPSGMVWNGNPMAFPVGTTVQNTAAALFIWATEDGTIAAWQAGLGISATSQAVTVVHNPKTLTDGPVYKGLAIGNNSRGLFLYATDFRDGKIAVWNSTFGADTMLNGKFIDSTIPSTFAPFGIQNINGQLWVTYAKQDAAKHDPVPGAGRGFVDVFDTDGNLLRRFATRGVLDAPWGVVLAPAHFGQFSNDILIGNFGDGKISAWDLRTHDFIDWMRNDQGKVIKLGTLWTLVFGGGLTSSPQTLYFTTGLDMEMHGLFGTLTPN
jgi:uncharacterized protein (TIGR03118 family)